MSENTKCLGILGKLFGHKFSGVLVEEIPYPQLIDFRGSENALKKYLECLSAKRYEIVCVRCGKGMNE